MTRIAVILVALGAVVGVPRVADAQVYLGRESPRRGSVEVSGGGLFGAGFELGRRTVQLTTSTPTGRFNLFTTDSTVGGFPGAFGGIGYYLTESIAIEGRVRYARPRLSVRLSDDAESATNVTARETVSHYVFGGSVVFHVPGGGFGRGRARPFIAVGAGHLRELHEGAQLVETGLEYHALAGVKYWFGAGTRRLGLRAEGGVSAREKGLDPQGDRRLLPVVLAGMAYLF